MGVGEDLCKVRAVALAATAEDESLLDDPPRDVMVTALNDYNVALLLRVWLGDEKQHVAARNRVRERVFEALRAAGVDMPYQTFALSPIECRGMPA